MTPLAENMKSLLDLLRDSSAVLACQKFERLVYKRLGSVPRSWYEIFYTNLLEVLIRDSNLLPGLDPKSKSILARNLDSAAEVLPSHISDISKISSLLL